MRIKIPLTLFSDINSSEICKGIVLRKIREEEITDFFGISNRKLDDELNLASCTPIICKKPTDEGLFHFGDVVSHALSNHLPVFSSNYIMEIDQDNPKDLINRLVITLKLRPFTRTGVGVYFDEKRSTNIISPNPYCKLGKYLSLRKDDLYEFQELLTKLEHIVDDPKFILLIEKYLFSVSGVQISDKNRFLELAIALEMILLPKSVGELNYRFSLRGSKLLNRYIGQDKKEAFDLMKTIYDVRSKLAHEGTSKKLNRELLLKCQEITSLFIKKYIEDDTFFSDENLNNVCID